MTRDQEETLRAAMLRGPLRDPEGYLARVEQFQQSGEWAITQLAPVNRKQSA
jgi:hypothetical protein